MKFTRFYKGNQIALGIVVNRGVVDLSESWPHLTVEALLEGYDSLKPILDGIVASCDRFHAPDELSYAPLTEPTKICCVGLNYLKHVEEALEDRPKEPLVFCKMPESVNVCDGVVPIPSHRDVKMDFEAELVVIIGKACYNATPEQADECIFGFTCGNDVSDRAAQFRSNQMLIGKGCPGFAPAGPNMVTKESFSLTAAGIRTRVNGVERQNSHTGLMMFKPNEIVSYISRYLQLNPGDMIYTGTPDGVIIGELPENRIWLKSGDVVEVEIDGIGTLRNQYM